MYIQPPDCKVVNLGIKFNNLQITGIRDTIDLRAHAPYVVLASQGGMLLGKGERQLAHAPRELRVGAQPRRQEDSYIDDIQKPQPIEQNEQFPLRQLIIILDRSSSMRHRLPLVQEQIACLGPHLKNLYGLKISLISFDELGKAEITYADNYGLIVRKVSELSLGSGTDIVQGLTNASNVLTRFEDFDPNSTDRTLGVFITDGEHNNFLTLPKINVLTHELTTLGNLILVVSGIGTAYSPKLNRAMAGHASSGAWSHIASSTSDKALKRLEQSDFFGKFLPRIIRQITGNDSFIRVDANGVERAWCIEPSVFENELPMETRGSSIQELGPAIWTFPTYMCLSTSKPEFTVTGQERITPRADFETTEQVEVVNFRDLEDPELRLRTIFAARKFLLSLGLQMGSQTLLPELNKIGLLPREQCQRFLELLERGRTNDDAKEDLFEETSSLSNESIGPLSGLEAEIANLLDIHGSEAAGYDLERALNDLDRNLGGKPSPRESLAGLPNNAFNDTRVNIAGTQQDINDQSGGLGPLDKPPVQSLKSFKAGAVEAYNTVQSPNINLKINVGDLNEVTEGVQIRPSSDISQKQTITVGKSRANDIVINVDTASRLHCCILRKGDDFFIKDLDSQNGTYVNGEDIRDKDLVPLKDGDVVRICYESFTVRFKEPNTPCTSTPISIPKEYIVGTVRVTPGALFKSRILIGREASCDIVVDDKKASRIHAYIESKNRNFSLIDIGSTNGTKVNGQEINRNAEPVQLKCGDVISIAGTSFKVIIH